MRGFFDLPGELRSAIYIEHFLQFFGQNAAPRVRDCSLLWADPKVKSEALTIAQDIVARLHRQAEINFDRLYEEYQKIWDRGDLAQVDAALDEVGKFRERRNWLAVGLYVLDELVR